MATAESCTGGWIAKALTDIAGSSQWFIEGFVDYSNEAKIARLGVPASILRNSGAVSEAAVRAMAEGALRRSGADLAVAVTGIAGPGRRGARQTGGNRLAGLGDAPRACDSCCRATATFSRRSRNGAPQDRASGACRVAQALMPMRLFFALWPDAGVRALIADAAAALRLSGAARPVPRRIIT